MIDPTLASPISPWLLALSPVICGLIGWFTNKLAVRMLFHPKNPMHFGLFTLQGVFPKRKKALATKLGDVIQGELFNAKDVSCLLREGAVSDELTGALDAKLDRFLRVKLVEAIPMAKMFLTDELVEKVKAALLPELTGLLDELSETACTAVEEKLDIAGMVRTKVEAFSTDKLEEVLNAIMKREFVFIELAGAVLGALVGLVQAAGLYCLSLQ